MRLPKMFVPCAALSLIAILSAACSAKPKPVTPAEAGKTAEQPSPVIQVPPESPAPPPAAEPTVESLPSNVDELNRKGYLKDVFFDLDRYDLSDTSRDALAKNSVWLRKWGSVQATLEGHCDERGTAAYNMALGEKRAQSARDYLVSLGIPADRLKVISYGKERPLVEGHDEQAWAQNRRGHFVITAR